MKNLYIFVFRTKTPYTVRLNMYLRMACDYIKYGLPKASFQNPYQSTAKVKATENSVAFYNFMVNYTVKRSFKKMETI